MIKILHRHFAFRAAKEVIAQFPDEVEYTVEAGVTPSGKIHLGNFNDVVIADAVLRALRKLGYTARGFLIVDSKDPFRKPPLFAPEEFRKESSNYIGRPFTSVPDPWNCHENYAVHFIDPVKEKLLEYGIDIVVKWADEIHNDPNFIKALLNVLERREEVRVILNKVRSKAGHKSLYDKGWIPYRPWCKRCGRIDEKVVPLKAEGDKVYYECKWCGYEGVASISKAEGKPPWRVDWPLRWYVLHVNFEPLGKDHMASGSGYDTGSALIEKIFSRKPPVPIFYDFVYWVKRVNNEKKYFKFSKREGIGLGVDEWLEIAPPEVLRFMILKRDITDIYSEALSHWEFDITMIPQYVQEFDRLEALYFEMTRKRRIREHSLIRDTYELSLTDGVPKERPKRLGYWQAVNVAAWMIDVKDGIEMLRKQGKLKGFSSDDIEDAKKRLKMASNWLLKVGYSVLLPSIEDFRSRYETLEDVERRAFSRIIRDIAKGLVNENNIGEEIREIAIELGLKSRKERLRIYKAFYRVLLNDESGPPLRRILAKKEFKEYLVKLSSLLFKT